MLSSLDRQDRLSPEEGKPSNGLVYVVPFAVQPNLFEVGLRSLGLVGHLEFGDGDLEDAGVDGVGLVEHALIDYLLEQRSEEVHTPIDHNHTLDVSIVLVYLDLICLNPVLLSLSLSMSNMALAALPFPYTLWILPKTHCSRWIDSATIE